MPAQCMQLITLIVRKHIVGFIERLKVSNNSIISCIDNSCALDLTYEIHGLNRYTCIGNTLYVYINVQLNFIFTIYNHHCSSMFF